MHKFLQGKTALVTGASRGIGRAIALRLGREGALVAVHYGSSRGAAAEVVSTIEAEGGQAFAVKADVRSVTEIVAMFKIIDAELASRAGSSMIDILVNNAGVGGGLATIEDTTEEMYDQLFSVNFKGLFFVSQQALPRLRDGGRVINISSHSTRGAQPMLAAYAASKSPINSLTLSLGKALGPRKITVNAVLPGLVETDLTEQLTSNPSLLESIVKEVAFGRVGQPEDIADVIVMLVSPNSGWITGELIVAAGGARL